MLLFSLEGYATFEISDTRNFIFINSSDSLLLSLNTGLSIRCWATTLRVCLLYESIKITETNRFTSYFYTNFEKPVGT